MATEGTFNNNNPTDINSVMTSGFSSIVKSMGGVNKGIEILNENITSLYTKSGQKAIDLHLSKQIKDQSRDLRKNTIAITQITNPILIAIHETLQENHTEVIRMMSSIAVLHTLVDVLRANHREMFDYNTRINRINKNTNPAAPAANKMVVTWDQGQFTEYFKNLQNIDNRAAQNIDSIEKLFGVIMDTSDEYARSKAGSFSLGSIMGMFKDDAFVKKTKTFVKSFDLAVNSITKTLASLDKSSEKIPKATEVLVGSLKKINEVSKDLQPQKIKAMAGGIALLGLALTGFALVSPAVLVAVGALTLLKGVTTVMATTTAKDLLMISAAIALFGLAIWGLGEVVTVESTLKTATAIIMLGLAIKGFTWAIGGGMGDRQLKTLLLSTITIAALGIALHTFNGVQWDGMLKAGIALGGLAGGIALLSAVPNAMVGAGALAMGAGALAVMGLGLALFPQDPAIYLPVGLFIAGFGTVMALAGTVAPFIAAGAVAMAAAGVALTSIAVGMAVISLANFNPDKISDFMDCLEIMITSVGHPRMLLMSTAAALTMPAVLLAATMATAVGLEMALISNLPYNADNIGNLTASIEKLTYSLGTPKMMGAAAILALVGTPLLLGATMATAVGIEMALLSKLTYNPERIGALGDSMIFLADGYVGLAKSVGIVGSIKFIAGVGMATTMAVATPLVAASLATVGLLARKGVDEKSINVLSYAIKSLFNVYADNAPSLFQIPKINASISMVGDMAHSTIGISKGIAKFSEISANPQLIKDSVDGVSYFVSEMIKVLSSKADEIDNMPKNVKSVLGIGNMMKDVADGMLAMSNMEYYETKLVNGEIVRVGEAKRFTGADFQRVGESVGMMLGALSKPLEEIGGSGGIFSKNKVKKGIEAMSEIGNVFNPIVDVVQAFSEHNINKGKIIDISDSVGALLLGMSATFQKLEKDKTTNMFASKSVMIDGLKDVFKYLGNIKPGDVGEVSKLINQVFDRIGDDKPFDKMYKNLQKIRKEVTLIKSETNKFDLKRLTIFGEMTKNLMESARTGSLEQLINAIRVLVDQVKQVNQTPYQPVQPYMLGGQQTTTAAPATPAQAAAVKAKQQPDTAADDLNAKLMEAMDLISREMKSLNQKIVHPFPVKVVAGQERI